MNKLSLFEMFDLTKINIAIEEKDADKAFDICNKLAEQHKRSGLELAQALWTLKTYWTEFEIDDDFFDNASLRLGLHRNTLVNYTRVIDMLKEAPENVQPMLMDKNIKDLIPIAHAVSQGYEIEDGQWDKLASATNYSEVSKVVREEIKEAEPRPTGITLKIDRDGSIWAWNNNNRYFVGSLEVTDKDEIVKKAVDRIVSNSGIVKV